jgi:hypothetical protein
VGVSRLLLFRVCIVRVWASVDVRVFDVYCTESKAPRRKALMGSLDGQQYAINYGVVALSIKALIGDLRE